MASPSGRVTTQAHGVMEGHTICSRGLCTFCKTAPSMLWGPDRVGMLDFGIPSAHRELATSQNEMGPVAICHKMEMVQLKLIMNRKR